MVVSLQYLVAKEWLGKDGRHPDRVDPIGRGDTHAQDVAGHYNRAPTEEKVGATQAIASPQYATAKGGRSQGMTVSTLA